ncbi:MAG: DUF362 domain-containing protein [Victivallales bacterium]|jgi:uncharacterized protein (DUF362 family)
MKNIEKTDITRRTFIRGGIAAGILVSISPSAVFAGENQGPEIWVIHGEDKIKLMKKCLEIINANGGLGKARNSLALKVNAGWDRMPEEGANTNPILVDEFLKGCREAGIKEIVLPEHSCHPANKTFIKSGIFDAAKKHDAAMIDLGTDKKSFIKVNLARGVKLKEVEISNYFTESDIVVNMPVAKHHSGAGLTMAMKNWMGAVKDRKFWHKNDLHQCIADMATIIKPNWTIIDATRTMYDGGPQGPAKNLKIQDILIVSKDQVAADAYAAKTLFPKEIYEKTKYIEIAGEMNLGIVDVEKMNVRKFEV